MRVCSLLPAATEIAFALGLGDDIVGVTHECDYPGEARHKPVVVRSSIDPARMSSGEIDRRASMHLRTNKSLYTIVQDRFREAGPDVVLTQGLCDVCALDYEEVDKTCRSLSHEPRIVSLTPNRLADVLRDIERVGEATGKYPEANELVRQLERRIQSVGEGASWLTSRPRVACLEWLDPIYCAGHWVPELVELAGGQDGLGRKGEPSAKVKWKEIIDYAPEVIVLMPCGFDVKRTVRESPILQRLEGWNDLPAVKARNVFAVNGGAHFSRPGPRLVDGLEILAQIIHPESTSRRSPLKAVQRLL